MRKAVIWIVVLGLLLGGGYIGDNMLRAYAQERVADAVSAEFRGSVSPPSVTLGGFPFALALITRSVPQVHVVMDTLPLRVSDTQIQLADVVADAEDVSLGTDTVSIAGLTGAARLSYADLAKIADVPITYAGDGRLELRYKRDLLGRSVTFAVSALPDLDVEGQVVRLTKPKLELADTTLDLVLTQDQLDSIVEPIKVDLDHDLRLTSLVPDDGGLAVGVEGTDLSVKLR